jgi:copper homeostasis protein CutC
MPDAERRIGINISSCSCRSHSCVDPGSQCVSDYSAEEIDIVQEQFRAFKRGRVGGVVGGLPSSDGEIDCKTMKSVFKGADHLDITIHRAFDHVRDNWRALTDLLERNVVHCIRGSGE